MTLANIALNENHRWNRDTTSIAVNLTLPPCRKNLSVEFIMALSIKFVLWPGRLALNKESTNL